MGGGGSQCCQPCTSWENVVPLLFCGMERPGAAAPSVPWSEWLMNKLGIKLSMTSDSHRADESVVASAYTSKNHSKRRTGM